MKYFFSVCLFFSLFACYGKNTDSLKKIVYSSASAKKRLQAAVQIGALSPGKNIAEAIAIERTGLNLALGLHNNHAAGLMLMAMGDAWYFNGRRDSAAAYFDRAAGLFAKLKPNTFMAGDYTRLAQAYARINNYGQAIRYYNTAITCAPHTGARLMLMAGLKQAGELDEARHNYREALNYYRQAFDISDSLSFVQKAKENTSEAYSRNFMGDVMGSIKQTSTSAPEILKIIDTKRSLNDTLALTINYFNLGVLYKSKKLYPQAMDALQSCLQYASAINYTDMQSSALNEMADLYEQTGDYRQSLIYLKKHMALNALQSGKSSNTIDELQTKYEITQREDQVLQQQFEITKRNYWMAGILVLIVLGLIISYIYFKQAKLKQRNTAMQAIIATEESERKRIAQDLHDSVSQTMMAAKINLTVINSELPFTSEGQRKRFEKAIGLVDAGFKEVRTISHNMMPWALHETGLAQVVQQFIDNGRIDGLQVNLFSKGFDVPFDSTTEIILYRVLQESVNNVIKHAAATRVDISLIRDEENITMTIEDNGKGFDATRPQVYRGMGLNNLQSRINFLKGRVELDSQAGKGTLVAVYIPIGKKNL